MYMKHTSASHSDQRTTERKTLFLAVTGPTASGKTELAMSLAERVGADIVCVDAMQAYVGLDVGTAKPSTEEQARVRHHGLDLAQPWETFNASRFAERVEPILQQALDRSSPLLLCGGTGLYYRALLEGFFETPEPNPDTRRRLQERIAIEGAAALHDELRRVDPQTAESVHPNDARRVARALEIIAQCGEPVSALRARQKPKPWLSMTRFVGLRRETDELALRIEERTEWMYRNGLVEETRWLMSMGCNDSWTAMQALGYKECWRALRNDMTLEEAKVETIRGTIRYAKRQMTWFRRQFPTDWIDLAPKSGFKEIEERCLNLWNIQGYNRK